MFSLLGSVILLFFLFGYSCYFKTLLTLVPSAAPNNVRTSVLNSTSIQLTWDAPDLSERNGILLYYTLTYFGVELDRTVRVVNYTVVSSNHSNLTYVFSGLQEYTVYEFSVAAHTSIGKGTAKTVDSRTNEAG